MKQSYVIIFIRYDYGIVIGKELKVSDYFIYRNVHQLRRITISIHWKDCYALLFPAEVKLILFIGILEVFDIFYMDKFLKDKVWEILVIEVHLITCDYADTG